MRRPSSPEESSDDDQRNDQRRPSFNFRGLADERRRSSASTTTTTSSASTSVQTVVPNPLASGPTTASNPNPNESRASVALRASSRLWTFLRRNVPAILRYSAGQRAANSNDNSPLLTASSSLSTSSEWGPDELSSSFSIGTDGAVSSSSSSSSEYGPDAFADDASESGAVANPISSSLNTALSNGAAETAPPLISSPSTSRSHQEASNRDAFANDPSSSSSNRAEGSRVVPSSSTSAPSNRAAEAAPSSSPSASRSDEGHCSVSSNADTLPPSSVSSLSYESTSAPSSSCPFQFTPLTTSNSDERPILSAAPSIDEPITSRSSVSSSATISTMLESRPDSASYNYALDTHTPSSASSFPYESVPRRDSPSSSNRAADEHPIISAAFSIDEPLTSRSSLSSSATISTLLESRPDSASYNYALDTHTPSSASSLPYEPVPRRDSPSLPTPLSSSYSNRAADAVTKPASSPACFNRAAKVTRSAGTQPPSSASSLPYEAEPRLLDSATSNGAANTESSSSSASSRDDGVVGSATSAYTEPALSSQTANTLPPSSASALPYESEPRLETAASNRVASTESPSAWSPDDGPNSVFFNRTANTKPPSTSSNHAAHTQSTSSASSLPFDGERRLNFAVSNRAPDSESSSIPTPSPTSTDEGPDSVFSNRTANPELPSPSSSNRADHDAHAHKHKSGHDGQRKSASSNHSSDTQTPSSASSLRSESTSSNRTEDTETSSLPSSSTPSRPDDGSGSASSNRTANTDPPSASSNHTADTQQPQHHESDARQDDAATPPSTTAPPKPTTSDASNCVQKSDTNTEPAASPSTTSSDPRLDSEPSPSTTTTSLSRPSKPTSDAFNHAPKRDANTEPAASTSTTSSAASRAANMVSPSLASLNTWTPEIRPTASSASSPRKRRAQESTASTSEEGALSLTWRPFDKPPRRRVTWHSDVSLSDEEENSSASTTALIRSASFDDCDFQWPTQLWPLALNEPPEASDAPPMRPRAVSFDSRQSPSTAPMPPLEQTTMPPAATDSPVLNRASFVRHMPSTSSDSSSSEYTPVAARPSRIHYTCPVHGSRGKLARLRAGRAPSAPPSLTSTLPRPSHPHVHERSVCPKCEPEHRDPLLALPASSNRPHRIFLHSRNPMRSKVSHSNAPAPRTLRSYRPCDCAARGEYLTHVPECSGAEWTRGAPVARSSCNCMSNLVADNFEQPPRKLKKLIVHAAKKFPKIPIFVTECHNEVLQFIYRAYGARHLPEKGCALVHFDAHPDMTVPRNMPAACAISNDGRLFEELSIENWIVPSLYAGVFDRVLWCKPPWAQQINEGDFDFKVGSSTQDRIYVTSRDDYFVSEGGFMVPEHLRNWKEVTLSVVQVPPPIPMGTAGLMRATAMLDHRRRPDGGFVLDIDLDYFSVLNPFRTLYPLAHTLTFLRKIFDYRQPKDTDDEYVVLSCSIERRLQLDDLERIFDILERTNGSMWGIEPLCAATKREWKSIQQLVANLHLAYDWSGKPIDWMSIHNAGCTLGSTGDLPHKTCNYAEIDAMVANFEEFLFELKPAMPLLITMARSAWDGYCPLEQVDAIQWRVCCALKRLYGDALTDKIIEHYEEEPWKVGR